MSEHIPNPETGHAPTAYEALSKRVDELLQATEPRVAEWNEGLVDAILRRKNPKFRSEFRELEIRHHNGYDGVIVRESKQFVDGAETERVRRIIGYYIYDRGSWLMGHAVWEAVLNPKALSEDDARAMFDNLEGRLGSIEASKGALEKFKVDHDL